MNIIQLFTSLAVVAGFWIWDGSAAPTAVRTTPDTITVTGADYAGIQPYAPSITIDVGTPMVDGFAWGTENTLIITYSVDPQTDYTIRAFTVDPVAYPADPGAVAEQFDFDLPITRENRLDWIVYNRILWERAMNDEAPTFFEISASVQRVQVMLEAQEQ